MGKKLYIFLLAGCFLFAGGQAAAQSQPDMRINEILVYNTDDYEDDYGHKHGWIELFNTSRGTVDIGGCYVSNDRNNLTKYRIPKGDVLTKIKPRQHIVLWADNMPLRGTFHINFTLEETNVLYLTSSNGRDVIDSLRFPTGEGPFSVMDYIAGDKGNQVALKGHIPSYPVENVSYGRLMDGEEIGGDNGWAFLAKTTPSSNNVILDSEAAAQRFKQFDPYGVIMAITAMSVVFIALILLYIVFKNVGRASISSGRKKAEKAGVAPHVVAVAQDAPGDVYAAIAAALYLCVQQEEAHDVENTILTINKVTRAYSPWSSKIYGLREIPHKQ
ncbi:MAG: lamin tail domain-containing protein [Prevotellaceae bacterium]|jgi:Na+-transporting methylmalonyl-CoA/oxaloacetate decarboxylase gamma subunit|nr:lamin tail domain-containing protein [Prevotellaceae bacterium]